MSIHIERKATDDENPSADDLMQNFFDAPIETVAVDSPPLYKQEAETIGGNRFLVRSFLNGPTFYFVNGEIRNRYQYDSAQRASRDCANNPEACARNKRIGRGLNNFVTGFTVVVWGIAAAPVAGAAVVRGGLALWSRGAAAAGRLAPLVAAPAPLMIFHRVIQSGGHTISAATAKILNSATGRNLAAREWGRAVEALKRANGLAPKYHGQITEVATYLDDLGNYVDDIESYLP